MTLDYGFDMIMDTLDDSFPGYRGFAKSLPNQPTFENDDVETIETCLNDIYRGKDVKISYAVKNDKCELPIIQELFLESAKDDVKKIVLSLLEDIEF